MCGCGNVRAHQNITVDTVGATPDLVDTAGCRQGKGIVHAATLQRFYSIKSRIGGAKAATVIAIDCPGSVGTGTCQRIRTRTTAYGHIGRQDTQRNSIVKYPAVNGNSGI